MALAGTAVSGLTSGLSGLFGANAAEEAAQQQAASIQKGIDFSQGMYDKGVAEFEPYKAAGTQALGQYQGLLANQQQPEFGYKQDQFQFDKWKDPSVDYAIQQANNALQASALAKGGMGGGMAKALQANTANIANKGYSNAFDRWHKNSQMMNDQAQQKYERDYGFQSDRLKNYGGLAQTGFDAAKDTANLGQGLAQSVSNMYGEQGNAQAQGAIGANNSVLGGLSGLSGALSTGLGNLGKLGEPTSSNPWQSYFDKASGNLLGDN